jgi:hypothetical protein
MNECGGRRGTWEADADVEANKMGIARMRNRVVI